MAEQTNVDKKLEGRLFDLLEARTRIPLGQLVLLRRRSRSAGITLLDAAVSARRIDPELAAELAAEAGLADRGTPPIGSPVSRPSPTAAPPPGLQGAQATPVLGSPGARAVAAATSTPPAPARAAPVPPAPPGSGPPPPPPAARPGAAGALVAPDPTAARPAPVLIGKPLPAARDASRPPPEPALPTLAPPPAAVALPRARKTLALEPESVSQTAEFEAILAHVGDPSGIDDSGLGDDDEPMDDSLAEDLNPADLFDLSDLEAEIAKVRVADEELADESDDERTGLQTLTPTSHDLAVLEHGVIEEARGQASPRDTSPPDRQTLLGSTNLGATDAEMPAMPNAGERYALGRELGRGGMGQVLEARDLSLERPVALKLLLEQDDVALRVRFIDEARVTGQLQHPGVPPVYEIGRLGDGRMFFAMRRIEGRTLRDIIEDLRLAEPEVERTFGRVRLLTLFGQVCRAIAYAHSRGVIHRDLKPDNIMLGAFGEVTVMDWGLAKAIGSADAPGPGHIATSRSTGDSRFSTQAGEVTGTPHYMPPEQAAGRVDELGPHSDIYSLGALLYELLTLEPPFDGPTVRAIREAVVSGRLVPPSERTPERAVPHTVEQLCLYCLNKEPNKRPKSAAWIADQIDEFLEGEQDRARKEAERKRLTAIGRAAADRWGESMQQLRSMQARTAQMRARLDPWAPIEERDRVWRQEDQEVSLRLQVQKHLSEALAAYHGALGVDGDSVSTRQALRELYYQAFELAERERDQNQMALYENLVRAFDDDGEYAQRLLGDGRLEIETMPRGVNGTLFQYRLIDRVLTPTSPQVLGQLPVRLEPVPMGSYLLRLQAPGLSDAAVPLSVSRQEAVRLRLRVFPDQVVGEGFVHVVGGPARLGGDPLAQLAAPGRVEEIGDFFIERAPVTCGEYAAFLRDVAARVGAAAARARAPRRDADGPSWWPLDEQGVPQLPEGGGELEWHADWPVVGVSALDAEAYCAWRTEESKQPHRLPTENEWEKAARGVDGRLFPWGDTFEPTFCHMGISRPGLPGRGPAGEFQTDKSPYGVMDLAGGVSEWTASWLDEARRQRIVKGGHWSSGPTECRAASRFTQPAEAVSLTLGFRTARTAPR